MEETELFLATNASLVSSQYSHLNMIASQGSLASQGSRRVPTTWDAAKMFVHTHVDQSKLRFCLLYQA